MHDDKNKIGKIFQIKEDKKIKEFNEEEIKICNKINELIKTEIFSDNLIDDFQNFYDGYYYYKSNKNEKGNNLQDLNENFKEIPFFLKYYDNNPTNNEVEIIKALCFLNIFIDCEPEERIGFIREFNNYIEQLFLEYKKYLSNKDKVMIMLNYLTIVKNNENEVNNYSFKLQYFYDFIDP